MSAIRVPNEIIVIPSVFSKKKCSMMTFMISVFSGIEMKTFSYQFIIMPRGPSFSQTSLRLYADGAYHNLPIHRDYQFRSPLMTKRRSFDPYVDSERCRSNYKTNNEYEVVNDYRAPKSKTRFSKGCNECEAKLNDEYMMSAQIKSSKKIRKLKTDVQLLKEKISNLQRIDAIRQQQIDRIRMEMYYVKMEQVESLSAKLLQAGKCKHKKRHNSQLFRDTLAHNQHYQEVNPQDFKTFTNLPQVPSNNSLPAFSQTERKLGIPRYIKSTHIPKLPFRDTEKPSSMRVNDSQPRQSRKNEAVNQVNQNEYKQFELGNKIPEKIRTPSFEEVTVLENQITHFSPSESNLQATQPVSGEEDKKMQVIFKGNKSSVEIDYIREAIKDQEELDTVRTQSYKTTKPLLNVEKGSRVLSKQMSSDKEPSQISSDYFKNRPLGHIKILEEEDEDQFSEKGMMASDVIRINKRGENPSEIADETNLLQSEIPYDYSMTSSIFVPKKSPQLKRIDLLTSVNSINFDMQQDLGSTRRQLVTQSNHPSLNSIHDIKFMKQS